MTDTLVIRHETVEEAVQSFGKHLNSSEGRVSHVVAFTDRAELKRLLTERRLEIIEAIMSEEPESVERLAEIVGNGAERTRKDVLLLSSRDIVKTVEEGSMMKPRIPYENVRVESDITTETV